MNGNNSNSTDCVIYGLGNISKLVAQKSRPLLDIIRTGLSLEALKMLDTYLAKIDSHDPNCKVVIFSKNEYEQLLGVTKIEPKSLNNYLDELMNPKTISSQSGNEILKVTLFDLALARRDEKGNSAWEIVLSCSEIAKKYIFNIENLGYLKYNLAEVVRLSSRYSYILYLYLKDNIHRRTWNVNLEKLKCLLGCNATPRYEKFKFFKSEILNNCKKEIEEKTNLRFSFDLIKEKRVVTAISFLVIELNSTACLTDSTENENGNDTNDEESREIIEATFVKDCVEEREFKDWTDVYGSDFLTSLAEACDFEFGRSEIELISRVLTRIDIPKDRNTDSLEWGRVMYLKEKYAMLCVEADNKIQSGQGINNRFAYFKGMLENDTIIPLANT